MLRALERHFEEVIACACITAAACFVFMQVILRCGFNIALSWTEELSGIAMVWAVYMGAALAVRERFHIRIMAGVVALPRQAARGRSGAVRRVHGDDLRDRLPHATGGRQPECRRPPHRHQHLAGVGGGAALHPGLWGGLAVPAQPGLRPVALMRHRAGVR